MEKNEMVKNIITGAVIIIIAIACFWIGNITSGVDSIRKQLDRSIELNKEAERTISKFADDLRSAKENNRQLESVIGNIESENKRIKDYNIQLESNNNKLRSGLIEGADYANRTEEYIIECLKIIQAKNNN